MAEKKQFAEPKRTRRVNFPVALLEILETDAKRCARTVNQQITAMLSAYYFGADVALRMARTRPAGVTKRKPAPEVQPESTAEAAARHQSEIEANQRRRQFRLLKGR